MPRFWLGALVIYAGLGFLDDNLIGVYGHMTWQEYTSVWVVLLVGVFDTLAIAMGVGFVFALLIFVMDYSGRGVIHSQKRGTFILHLLTRITHKFFLPLSRSRIPRSQ